MKEAGDYRGPFTWLCGWLCVICSYINPCALLFSCIRKFCSTFKCCRDCFPDKGDFVGPESVTGSDYKDEDWTLGQAGIREKSRIKQTCSSFFGFLFGVTLTLLYGYIVLYWKNYDISFCVVSSVLIGFFLCIGMAFSRRIRITVFLMIPHMFSGCARITLVAIIFAMAMQGPGYNIVTNIEIGAEHVSCGIETALKQTEKIYKKLEDTQKRCARITLVAIIFAMAMQGPGYNIVTNIEIGAEHVSCGIETALKQTEKIYKKLEDTQKRKSLNHFWTFISSIGDICNEELLNPHRKCLKVFQESKNDCLRKGFDALCNIIDGLNWLCELGKTVTVMCVVPSYVGEFIHKNLKTPIAALMKDVKEQFDYNIVENSDFGINVNSSKSIFTIVRDILKKLNEDLDPYREALHIFSYSVFLISVVTYLQALSYLRNYTTDNNFDNIYITRQFVNLDVMRAKQGKSTLLPLMPRESYKMVRPMAFKLTRRERKGYSFQIFKIFGSLLLVSLIIISDYFVFWTLESISSIRKEDIILNLLEYTPETFLRNFPGGEFVIDLLHNLGDTLDVLGEKSFTNNVSPILHRQCIPKTSEPDYFEYLTIGVLYIVTFFAAFFGVYIHRIKRFICASYYPHTEQERICFLYNKLLTKRMNLEDTLKEYIRKNAENQGHSNILMILAAHIPGFGCIARFFGSSDRHCMACARICTSDISQDFKSCITNGCSGFYCQQCLGILHNVCVICMGPLAYDTDLEEELLTLLFLFYFRDSSNDEQLCLWIEAMKTLKGKKEEKKKMKMVIKKHLRNVIRKRGMENEVLHKYREARGMNSDEESSDFSDPESGSDSGVTDYEYQDRSESSDCESDDLPTVKFRLPRDPVTTLFT
ncbi:DC-STAMP domain-containing protein 2 [Pyxicephalus adspersus]|uniref:DC-STAMP domain-containing protein 2 n=1 Tax=Pyxicephalus adspersus TaxID=30357 RepID=UPI003B5A1B63